MGGPHLGAPGAGADAEEQPRVHRSVGRRLVPPGRQHVEQGLVEGDLR
jgi:hypothetical protein